MNSKITIQSLISTVANISGFSRRQSEDFIKEFTSLIVRALETDGIVKIKQLGTFKLISVESRKSIDVNTGEEINISGHNKVTFIPSKEMASRVNWAFEDFEAVEVNVDSQDVEKAPLYIASQDIDLEFDSLAGVETGDDVKDIEDTAGQDTIEEESHADIESVETRISVISAEESEEAEDEDENEIDRIYEPDEESPKDDSISSFVENGDLNTEPSAVMQELVGESEETAYEHEPQVDEEIILDGEEAYDVPDQDPEGRECSGISTGYHEIYRTHSRHRYGWGFLAGFICAAVLCGIAALGIYIYNNTLRKANVSDAPVIAVLSESEVNDTLAITNNSAGTAEVKEQNVTEDSQIEEGGESEIKENIPDASQVNTRPSDQPVYDTISRTRYLTTMAKDHYGNYNLWPYIYEENKRILGHPDRIRPGTRVIIPPLSKYGVDPKNKLDIEKSKKLGIEIYSRFN